MIVVLRHISIEGPGIIGDFFEKSEYLLKIIELDNGDKLPGDFKDIEAIITLGGSMNVYQEDRYPFLKDEDHFLKSAIGLKIPILGICLGAQLLAKAAGAKVAKSDHEEIGWYRVDLTKEGRRDPLFYGLDRKPEVFQWHEDQFDIPEGSILLATSEGCTNQAFRVGENGYGMQFHIEVTPPMIESWIKEYLSGSDPVGMIEVQKMLLETNRNKQIVAQAEKILLNFSKIIEGKAVLSA